MECMGTGRKRKQNTTGGKKFRDYGHKKDTMVSDYITNTQLDTIIHSKTQIDIQEDQPNRKLLKSL